MAEFKGARTVVFLEESSSRCDADSMSLTNLALHISTRLRCGDRATHPAKRLILLSRPITSDSTTSPPTPEGGPLGGASDGGMAGPGPAGSIRGTCSSRPRGRCQFGDGGPRKRGRTNWDETAALRATVDRSKGRMVCTYRCSGALGDAQMSDDVVLG